MHAAANDSDQNLSILFTLDSPAFACGVVRETPAARSDFLMPRFAISKLKRIFKWVVQAKQLARMRYDAFAQGRRGVGFTP